MDYTKPFKFLKNLPPKLNSFYNKRSSSGVKVSNKSKTKKDFDPVTNFDRAFEKYIRSLINKKFPKDSIIGVLSFLSFETSTGFWLMFSFGSTTLIVLVFHDSEFAQPANIFFGHLLAIIIGVIFNEILGISFVSLGLSVGLTITLMMYFKVIHPPAAANPLIALFADVSVNYILFPVIAGSVSIIVLSIIFNRYLLKRNYPKRWF